MVLIPFSLRQFVSLQQLIDTVFIFCFIRKTGKKKDHNDLQASFNIIRVGQYYRLINYGETYTFEALEIISNDDCIVRSIDTLEKFQLSDLVKFGKGADFDFEEI